MTEDVRAELQIESLGGEGVHWTPHDASRIVQNVETGLLAVTLGNREGSNLQVGPIGGDLGKVENSRKEGVNGGLDGG